MDRNNVMGAVVILLIFVFAAFVPNSRLILGIPGIFRI